MRESSQRHLEQYDHSSPHVHSDQVIGQSGLGRNAWRPAPAPNNEVKGTPAPALGHHASRPHAQHALEWEPGTPQGQQVSAGRGSANRHLEPSTAPSSHPPRDGGQYGTSTFCKMPNLAREIANQLASWIARRDPSLTSSSRSLLLALTDRVE